MKQVLDQSAKPQSPGVEQLLVGKASPVSWNPWIGLIFIILAFFTSQLVGSLLISIYPLLHHWTSAHSNAWLNSSIIAQFFYVLFAESFIVGAIYMFLRHYKTNFRSIGLRKPRWSDPLVGLAAVVPYFILYSLTVGLASHLFSGLNVNQTQEIGFNNVHGAAQLILTFISLVILPPLTEEIMMRGFLYGSLKKLMPTIAAGFVTSLIFASLHLPEGGSAGPLYIAALDTFVLSVVLVYIREKTDGLYAGMTLHAIKNGIAFVALFVVGTH
jgi:membrane protease YdiL (CAAX protease family)